MFGDRMRRMRGGRRRAPGGLKPTIEGLEGRQLLYSTLGGQWAFGSRITYSFAPDGASVGGTPNALSQAMAARGLTEAQWKTEVRRAAAQWQSAANINLVEVADSGAALGVAGNQQGDSRFGDIRLFAAPQPASSLGYAFLPPPANGGTRAGDIVLNSSTSWNVGANFDLQTVALHELGHALGVGHSSYADAAMFDAYNGVKQGLTGDDVAGLRAVYGARPHDWVDQFWNNKDPSNAVNISNLIDANHRVTLTNLDLNSNQDDDWFYVQAPAGASGEMVVTMQSKDLSLLSPRFQVYNAALQMAGWTVTPNPGTVFGSTISLRFLGVPAGTGVYVKAMGWNGPNSGANGIGAYALRVDFSGGPIPTAIASPPVTTVAEQPDQGGGSANQGVAETLEVAVPAYPASSGRASTPRVALQDWEGEPGVGPSYGTVAFVVPAGPGRTRQPDSALASSGLPAWFVLSVDAALPEGEAASAVPAAVRRTSRGEVAEAELLTTQV